MKIVTHMIADEVYESANENGNKLIIDMRARDIKQHQSPVEVLLSSVAACGAVDIVLMLKKRRKTIQDFTIETEGTRREETPRSFTAIHCQYIITSPDVTEEELHKTAKLSLEKYCSVVDTLKIGVSFSVKVIRP